MGIITTGISILAISFFSVTSLAQTDATVSPRVQLREDHQATLEDAQSDRQAARDEARTARQQAQTDRQAARDEARETRISKREDFRANLSEIRDQRKVEIVERIVANFDKMNDKWVDHWSRALTRLSEILDKIETRAASAQDGADTSAVDAAVADARAAIASAQTAVDTQAGKTYTPQIGDEDAVGQVVRSTIATFRNDIKATSQTVKDARAAVTAALRTLKGNSLQNRNLEPGTDAVTDEL